jgi:hypothetical protein
MDEEQERYKAAAEAMEPTARPYREPEPCQEEPSAPKRSRYKRSRHWWEEDKWERKR